MPRKRFLLPLLLSGALLMVGGAQGLGAELRDGGLPKAVSLSDASYPPAYVHLVQPGKGYVPLYCEGEVSAYTWKGGKIGPQRWNKMHDRMFWRGNGGKVWFDGVRWYNSTRSPVLVAGWCNP